MKVTIYIGLVSYTRMLHIHIWQSYNMHRYSYLIIYWVFQVDFRSPCNLSFILSPWET